MTRISPLQPSANETRCAYVPSAFYLCLQYIHSNTNTNPPSSPPPPSSVNSTTASYDTYRLPTTSSADPSSRCSSQDTAALASTSTPAQHQCFYHHVPHVRQLFNWDCGLSCVLMILRAVGIWHQDLATLRTICATTRCVGVHLAHWICAFSCACLWWSCCAHLHITNTSVYGLLTWHICFVALACR